MPLTITHSTPADGTFSATGATAWNANHSFTVSGTSGELQYNSGGDLAGMSGTSWNDTTRSLTLTGATITASAPVFDVSQTWNNAAATFTGLRANFTDTASNASSLLLDLQRGGTSRFTVRKDGWVSAPLIGLDYSLTSAIFFSGANTIFYISSGEAARLTSASFSLPSSNRLDWNSDLILTRRGAANLRLGAADAAAPVAQTLSVQSVVAGTTNTAGANLTITGSQGTGTGAGGSIIFQVAPAGSSGTAQNALATALTINSSSQVVFADGSNTAPSIRGSDADSGIYFSGNNIRFATDSTFTYLFDGGGNTNLRSTAVVRWTDGGNLLAAYDLILLRDAANTLALRNGTNAQTFNVYKSFTDASNYSRIALWATGGGNFQLATQVAGTGVGGILYITNASASSINFQTSNTDRWFISGSAGHFLASTDNTVDIGAVAATRPRDVYVAGTVSPGRGVTVAGLPTPSTGMMARVTDATAPVVGSTVVGGGAAAALVWYNGANWTVIGV